MEYTKELRAMLAQLIKGSENNICNLADKIFDSEENKIEFVMTYALNLYANMCLNNSKEDMESMKHNASQSIERLSNWYDVVFKSMEEKKDMH